MMNHRLAIKWLVAVGHRVIAALGKSRLSFSGMRRSRAVQVAFSVCTPFVTPLSWTKTIPSLGRRRRA